jgi:hypothetical protein
MKTSLFTCCLFVLSTKALLAQSADPVLNLRCHMAPKNEPTAIQQQLLENRATQEEDFEMNFTRMTAHTINGLFDTPVPMQATATQISFAGKDGVGHEEYVYIDRVTAHVDVVNSGFSAGEVKWEGFCERAVAAF